MKRLFVIVLIIAMILSGCNTANTCIDNEKPDKEAPCASFADPTENTFDIDALRDKFVADISLYLESNLDTLTAFAKWFSTVEYSSVTYDALGFHGWIRDEYIEMDKESLQDNFQIFFNQHGALFCTVYKVNGSDELISSIDSVAFITMSSQANDGVRISSWLCYGEGIANALIMNDYYTVVLNSDWVLHFNYDEDSSYYENYGA